MTPALNWMIETMKSDNLRAAARGLYRIYTAIQEAETLTGRSYSDGRNSQLMTLEDSLSSWDATELRLAEVVGINLTSIASSARDAMDEMRANWK